MAEKTFLISILLIGSMLFSNIGRGEELKDVGPPAIRFRPRLRVLRTKDLTLAGGILAPASAEFRALNFRTFISVLAEQDFSGDQPQHRREAGVLTLYEGWGGYIDTHLEIKVGRANVSWSPILFAKSLDLWTGTRFNRLFLDEDDTLLWIHPLGVDVRTFNENLSLEVFQSATPVYEQVPEPLLERKEQENTEWGAKFTLMNERWRLSGVTARKLHAYVGGAQLEYSSPSLGGFFEVGGDGFGGHFESLRLDVKIGEVSLTPQLSNYQSPAQWPDETQQVYLLDFGTRANGKGLGGRVLYNAQIHYAFGSLHWTQPMAEKLDIRLSVQRYSGGEDRIYRLFQNHTLDSNVIGLSLRGDYSL